AAPSRRATAPWRPAPVGTGRTGSRRRARSRPRPPRRGWPRAPTASRGGRTARRLSFGVGDLDEDAPALAHRARADERAQRPRDPALAADHLADVVGSDMEHEHERPVAFLGLDANCVGIVDELACQIREQLGHYLAM